MTDSSTQKRRLSDKTSWFSRFLKLRPNYRRWGDVNYHWLMFTYSPPSGRSYNPLGISLESARGDNEDGFDGCHLRLQGFGHTLIVELPPIIKPLSYKVYPKSWDAATVDRLGRNYYVEHKTREYGFQFWDTSLHIYYGVQTDSSTSTKSKCYSYPWVGSRVVAETYYDKHMCAQTTIKPPPGKDYIPYAETKSAKDSTDKLWFKVKDYDGKEVLVSTYVSETVWARGVKRFKWFSWFVPNQVRRDLNISFESEVGPEKGSWKGGLMGTGFTMLKDENHEQAFLRYLTDQSSKDSRHRVNLTYMGIVQV